MKDYILNCGQIVKNIVKEFGYEADNVELLPSSRPDLGQYQYNGIMSLAKKYHQNPIDIANKVVSKMKENDNFININIAGPGFINITFSDNSLINYLNKFNIEELVKNNKQYKKIIIDYGGPNVAKVLHVGHLRSANIGEALKRLCKKSGYEVISDVHLGDYGRQMGMIINEIQERNPNLSYFSEKFDEKEKVDFEISNSDLETIYPIASNKAKLDENYMEKSRKITYELQSENKGYYALWKKIVDTSVSEIKKLYDKLYVSFDLWNGESDASKYIPEMMEYLKEKKLLTESDGALIIDISKKEDTKEMPPLILIKSNGAVSYEATDLATIWERMKNYSPDEIWYVVDNRQELHFEQVFRAAYKAGIVPESVKLEFIGFGTMNGNDGKPFKTRDGGVMSLSNLLSLAKEETYKKLNPGVPDNKKDEISTQIAVSALKYADLLPNRETDYIFDLTKFTDMNGKTGPYLLYSTIRIRSLLNKANDSNIPYTSLKKIVNNYDREVILNLLNLKSVINKSLKDKSLNEITEYLYKLTNSYNNFYSENRILTEEDDEKRESWLYLSKIVYNVNMYLLNILGIEVPEKM